MSTWERNILPKVGTRTWTCKRLDTASAESAPATLTIPKRMTVTIVEGKIVMGCIGSERDELYSLFGRWWGLLPGYVVFVFLCLFVTLSSNSIFWEAAACGMAGKQDLSSSLHDLSDDIREIKIHKWSMISKLSTTTVPTTTTQNRKFPMLCRSITEKEEGDNDCWSVLSSTEISIMIIVQHGVLLRALKQNRRAYDKWRNGERTAHDLGTIRIILFGRFDMSL